MGLNPAAEVSGRAFLGIVRQVKDAHGDDGLRAAIARAGSVVAPIFADKILMMRWYPYHAFIAFLRAIDLRYGQGNLQYCRTLGASAGKRDLGTVFSIYRALASPERLIRSCTKVWPSYYRNAGRMEAVTWTPEDTTLRIYDFPTMDRAHCRLMEGWMMATMEQIKVKIGPGARETACMAHGEPYHEFRCTWSA